MSLWTRLFRKSTTVGAEIQSTSEVLSGIRHAAKNADLGQIKHLIDILPMAERQKGITEALDSVIRNDSVSFASRSCIITYLLSLGPNQDTIDKSIAHSLFVGYISDWLPITNLLLKAGARVDGIKRSEMFLAALAGRVDEVRKHIAARTGGGCGEHAEDPLRIAAAQGHGEIVKCFLDNHVYPDHHDRNFDNALSLATQFGHTEVVGILLSSGAKVPRYWEHGRDPLVIAAKNGNVAIVELLLKAGANPDGYADKQGSKLPLWVARTNGHNEVVKALLAAGARDDLPVDPMNGAIYVIP